MTRRAAAQVAVQRAGPGTRALINIDDASAPERYEFRLSGDVSRLQLNDDGSVAAYDSTDGLIGGFPAPWARDAAGRSVPTHYEVNDTVLVQLVEHRAGNFEYGITADPFWLGLAIKACMKVRCYRWMPGTLERQILHGHITAGVTQWLKGPGFAPRPGSADQLKRVAQLMIYAALEAVTEAVLQALGWMVRMVRGMVASSAADAGLSAAEDMGAERCGRGRARRRLKQLAATGDVEELVRVYRRCGRGNHEPSLRIEALLQLAHAEASTAEPLLREVIEGPDDTWVTIAALDIVARCRMTGLADAVVNAKEDPRPAVATAATLVHKRLDKGAGRSLNQSVG